MALNKKGIEGAAEAAPFTPSADIAAIAEQKENLGKGFKTPSVFVFTNPAHNSDGTIGVHANGEEIEIKVSKSGRIEFPCKDFLADLKVRNALVAIGWKDETDYPRNLQPEAPLPTLKTIRKWHFRHPEAGAIDPVNCSIGFYVNGAEISVDIKDSKCIVTDAVFAQALEKHGYVCEKTEE